MCICLAPTTCPRSFVLKRKVDPSFLTPNMNIGLNIRYAFNVTNTASATPKYPGCCGTTCALFATQRYVRHASWINGYSFHITFCHRSHNLVCFLLPSCCTTAGSDPIALMSNTFVHCMVMNNKQVLLYWRTCTSKVSSFVRTTC